MHRIKSTTLSPRHITNCTYILQKGVVTISKPEEELPFKRFKCSARREHTVPKSGAGMESGRGNQLVAAPSASS